MMYNTRNYLVFGLCPASGILETRKQRFRNLLVRDLLHNLYSRNLLTLSDSLHGNLKLHNNSDKCHAYRTFICV
jgi:hypothetical protein